jgi:orotidine-5'-phosphate decarboxylase
MNPIILALDTDNIDTACAWIEATNSAIATYKAGLEFFLNFGAEGISQLRSAGDFDLFLDLKLHDIPHTVSGATKAVAHINPKFLTVHASGGSEMIRQAVEVAPDIDITAVTILTSLDDEALSAIGYAQNSMVSAVNLAELAVKAGARAIVSSPLEVRAIRERVGNEVTIITPGVRPAGSAMGDQSRVLTPRDAIAAGSTYLVIGRPITSLYLDGSRSNVEAMRKRAEEICDEATSS